MGLTIPLLTKTPDEKKSRTYDFAAELVPGSSLTGTAVMTVTPPGLTVTPAAPAFLGTLVTIQIAGGVLGAKHRIACRMAADNGDIHEIAFDLLIVGEN